MNKLPKDSLGYGQQPREGKWVRPRKRGYLMQCCDCGLTHRIDFDHVPCGRGRKVIIRAWVDDAATRRARKIKERRKTTANTASTQCPIGLHEIKVNVKPRRGADPANLQDAKVWFQAVKDTYLYMCKRLGHSARC